MPEHKEGFVQLSAYVRPETRQRLKLVACAHGRSLSREVETALESWIETHAESLPTGASKKAGRTPTRRKRKRTTRQKRREAV